MTDRDVQGEIEENERRVRDEQDVGLDEDVVEGQENDGGFLDDLGGGILGNDGDSRERDDQRRKDDTGA